MTLKEKICEPFDGLRKETANELEQIADEFAIEFAEWLRVNYYDNGESWTEWNSDDNTYSSKELLEIFKKENKL